MCAGPNCTRELPPDSRSDQTFCSQGCRLRAFRQRRRLDKLRSNSPETAQVLADEMSLTEQYEPVREHRAAQDPGDGLRQYSDYGQVPGDLDDEQTARVHAMLEADEARRVPRRPWSALRRAYAANPGVELADITQERTERHQAQQRAVKARSRAAPGQVQDPHNDQTRDAVAQRAASSRKLNKVYATADPRPPAQRQEFAFDAEQAQGSFYRGGRARGQQSRHADYQWNMRDGW